MGFSIKLDTVSHDSPVCILRKGAQWLSGRVLDLRLRGSMFEPHRYHCVVSLSKTHLSLPRKTHPDITEILLTGM